MAGCYAVSVSGDPPEWALDYLYQRKKPYIPRDRT